MKRIAICAFGAFMMAYAPQAQAQALLRGLADKAKEKVESKVTEKVGKMLTKPKGGATAQPAPAAAGAQTKPAATSADENGAGYGHAEVLAPGRWDSGEYFSVEKANFTGDYDDHGNRVLRMTAPTIHFSTFSEAIAALPALPTAQQILDENVESATVKAIVNHALALDELNGRLAARSMEMAMKQAEAGMKMQNGAAFGAQQGMPMPITNAFVGKLSEAIHKSGLDPETASEEELMKVTLGVMSKELGIPEAEMAKLMAMAQTNPEGAMEMVMKKYPQAAKQLSAMKAEMPEVQEEEDPNMEKLVALYEELSALNEDAALLAAFNRGSRLQKELASYAREVETKWEASETCAKINAMEQALSERLDAYHQANNTGYNDEAPAFWVEARKEQNALIEAYNLQIAEQWRAMVQDCLTDVLPASQRLAEAKDRFAKLSEEIDFSGDPNVLYQYQLAAGVIQQMPSTIIYDLPAIAMDAPRIGHVLEQWMP